jgi:Ca2+-binding EF-hand superfamily protein
MNLRKTRTLIAMGAAAVIASLTLAPVALADETAELEAKFTASDTNSDGKLTRDEAKEGGMRRIVRGFDKIDTEGNGYVTLDQIKEKMNSR